MMRRIVVCLDVDGGRVVKGVRFQSLRDIGDPAELAARYEEQGADEIVFLDISASAEGRGTLLDAARRTAEQLFVPLTIGGGIRSVDDIARTLRSGADKVSINSAAVARPTLLSDAALRFGSQCIVASIDAKDGQVFIHGGRTPTSLDAIEWARTCVAHGAGEILLTSIDRDGARTGYDRELTRAVARTVGVPVVASGGAGTPEDVAEVLQDADAALVAGIVHDGVTTVDEIKAAVTRAGIPCRP
jgi:cyclase